MDKNKINETIAIDMSYAYSFLVRKIKREFLGESKNSDYYLHESFSKKNSKANENWFLYNSSWVLPL